MLIKAKNSIAVTSLVAISLFGSLFASSGAHAQTCESLFATRAPLKIVNESWLPLLEQDYQSMLQALGAVNAPGEAIPQFGIGKLIYQNWQRNPGVEDRLFALGFKVAEPSATNPNEVARFVFPQSFAEMAHRVQELTANHESPIKLAVFQNGKVHSLEDRVTIASYNDTVGDMPFKEYARMKAAGFTPLYPAKRNLGFIHDLAHVTEEMEFPKIRVALQGFFSRYLNEGWDSMPYYRRRAETFNEVSYILRSEKYEGLDSLIVSRGIRFGSLALHAAQLRKALRLDLPGTLEKISQLTDSFNELFIRHGGGARDLFNVESSLLTIEVVKHYVEAMKSHPSDGSYQKALAQGSAIEALESLEGLNRQIQYTVDRMKNDPNDVYRDYLAYRVAQLEIAMLSQRKLELSQVDIIQDSMLPIGVDSKTRRYFKSFQPANSDAYKTFVDR